MSIDLFKSGFTIPSSNPAIPAESPWPGDLPLVLLPVRLETRFFVLQSGVTELRVRIYPDKIHLDSHEPDLTADEQTWGRHYWQQNWSAFSDVNAIGDGWRQIADRFGERRAAWIVRALEPTSASQRPSTPPAAGEAPAVPIFPTLPVPDSDATWRSAPQARLMPDRWVAVVHSGGRVAISVTGSDI